MELEREKQKLEKRLLDEWNIEKQAFEDDEQETAQGRQAIIKQIEDTKDEQKKLQMKVKDLERRIRGEQNDLEDF